MNYIMKKLINFGLENTKLRLHICSNSTLNNNSLLAQLVLVGSAVVERSVSITRPDVYDVFWLQRQMLR